MSTAADRCLTCGSFATDILPVVENKLNENGPFICARCWVDYIHADPDVQFVLNTIDQYIPAGAKAVRDYHHTVAEWSAAVLSIRTLRDMRRFFAGYTLWRLGPEKSTLEAAQEARDNIGCPLNDAGWWRRLKWRWACDITPSSTFHM